MAAGRVISATRAKEWADKPLVNFNQRNKWKGQNSFPKRRFHRLCQVGFKAVFATILHTPPSTILPNLRMQYFIFSSIKAKEGMVLSVKTKNTSSCSCLSAAFSSSGALCMR